MHTKPKTATSISMMDCAMMLCCKGATVVWVRLEDSGSYQVAVQRQLCCHMAHVTCLYAACNTRWLWAWWHFGLWALALLMGQCLLAGAFGHKACVLCVSRKIANSHVCTHSTP
jgi:hypothetical protein